MEKAFFLRFHFLLNFRNFANIIFFVLCLTPHLFKDRMTIDQIFQNFNNLKVLIIGDLMVDSYVWGDINRQSPEAPVPIVNVKKREIRLGGAGNVVLNIKSLGAEPIICSVLGNDSFGESIIAIFKANNLNTEGILKSDDRITTVKERIIASDHHVVRIDTETDELLNMVDRELLIKKIKALALNTDVIIFQDYDKGVISLELIDEITAFAQNNSIPIVVDPKKRNFMHYQNATLFKPNLKEIKEGLSISFDSNNAEDIERAVNQLKEKLNLKGAFLTLSEKGVYIDYLGEKRHIQAHVRKIADVSGAGDTVISIAACCVALGLAPHLTAELSNLGGGLVCEQVGVVPINKNNLLFEAKKYLA
jgi:D-glycero-beta-D-manno-heptose-7-phosphate kinase